MADTKVKKQDYLATVKSLQRVRQVRPTSKTLVKIKEPKINK